MLSSYLKEVNSTSCDYVEQELLASDLVVAEGGYG